MKYNYLNTYKQLALLLFMATCAFTAQAQFDEADVYLRIYGSIADSDNNERLDECVVRVTKDNEFEEEYTTKYSGKFEFFLPAGYEYRFFFEKNGYVGKNIEISTVEAADMDEQFIFSLKADISLFKHINGMNYTVLKEPIGRGYCNGRKGKVQFDKQYTREMEEKIAHLYVPIEANTSLATRVSIEETITEVPEDDDDEYNLTVDEIFIQAEKENEMLALEEVKTPALQISKTDKIEYQIKEEHLIPTPKVKKIEPEVISEPIIEKKKTQIVATKVEPVKKSSKIKVDDIIVPVRVVESEPYKQKTNGLIWRIQAGAFTQRNVNAFHGVTNLDFVTNKKGNTICVVGTYDNPMDAAKEKIRLINAGYKDAFLTVYRGNKRISFEEAGVDLAHISYTKIKEEIND